MRLGWTASVCSVMLGTPLACCAAHIARTAAAGQPACSTCLLSAAPAELLKASRNLQFFTSFYRFVIQASRAAVLVVVRPVLLQASTGAARLSLLALHRPSPC